MDRQADRKRETERDRKYRQTDRQTDFRFHKQATQRALPKDILVIAKTILCHHSKRPGSGSLLGFRRPIVQGLGLKIEASKLWTSSLYFGFRVEGPRSRDLTFKWKPVKTTGQGIGHHCRLMMEITHQS